MTHAIGFQEITGLRIQGLQQAPLSPALQATVQSGAITWSAGMQHHMEIGFDGETPLFRVRMNNRISRMRTQR